MSDDTVVTVTGDGNLNINNGRLTMKDSAVFNSNLNGSWSLTEIGDFTTSWVEMSGEARMNTRTVVLGWNSNLATGGDEGDGRVVIGGSAVWTTYKSTERETISTPTDQIISDFYHDGNFYVGGAIDEERPPEMQGRGELTILESGELVVSGAYVQNRPDTALEFGLFASRNGGRGATGDTAFLTAAEVSLQGTLRLTPLDLAGAVAGDTLLFLLIDSASAIGGAFDEILFDGTALDQLAAAFNYDDSDAASGLLRWDDTLGNHYTLQTQDYGAGNQLALSVEVVQVPEPGTWALLAGGFGGLACLMRRRRAGV